MDAERRELIEKFVSTSLNYFEKFDLEVGPTDPKIVKNAYKKIALRLHPDKCKHPQAAEAFKAVLEAFECLFNPSTQEGYLHHINTAKAQKSKPRAKAFNASKSRPADTSAWRTPTGTWYWDFTPDDERQKRRKTDEPAGGYHRTAYDYSSTGSSDTTDTSTSAPSSLAYSCKQCRRTFPNKQTLNRHMMFASFNHRKTNSDAARPRQTKDFNIYDLRMDEVNKECSQP